MVVIRVNSDRKVFVGVFYCINLILFFNDLVNAFIGFRNRLSLQLEIEYIFCFEYKLL